MTSRRLLAAVTSTMTVLAVLAVAGIATTGELVTRWAGAEPEAPDEPPPHETVVRTLAAAPVPSPPPDEFVAWALLDRRTGDLTGSWNWNRTSTTASMIKAWIAADDLRRTADAGEEPSPERLAQLRLMIRDSDNRYAELIFQELGAEESIERLFDSCGLTDSRAAPGRWSTTQLSPRDSVRMGACIADGRAAGPEWTDWLLAEMRAINPPGDFGIPEALPAEQADEVAVKNGWVVREADDEYHVNCLAISDDWVMAVMTRYPAERGYEHGAGRCASAAAAHLPETAPSGTTLAAPQFRPYPH